MFKFDFLSQKNFQRTIFKLNTTISSVLDLLAFSNLYANLKKLIKDKRTIITTLVVIISVFAHLSTPAFYKDEWVKEKIKNQFEKNYSLKIKFTEKFYYSIFPVPNFVFKNVKIFSENNDDLIEIKKLTTNLSFKRFFDKNKMNIQNIEIEEANFNLGTKELFDYKDYIKKE